MKKSWKSMLLRGAVCSMIAAPVVFVQQGIVNAEEDTSGFHSSGEGDASGFHSSGEGDTSGFHSSDEGDPNTFHSDADKKPGFFYENDKLYYRESNGSVRTRAGWLSVGGKWYFVNEGGSVRRNTGIWSGGSLYYAGDDGALTGGIFEVNGHLRYFDESGEILKKEGWILYNKKWYYLDANGIVKINTVIPDGNNLYYAGSDGALQEAVASYEGNLYYFNKNGKAKKTSGWTKNGDDWYFALSGGALARNRMVGPSNNLYYVGSDGKATGGVQEYNGVKYFFEDDGALTKKAGWKLVDGVWYYADANGKIRVNCGVWSGNTVYYLGENGTLTGGVHMVSGKVRYFDENGKLKKHNGWLAYEDKWYFIDKNGIAYANGKYLINGKYYYFDENGVMKTGVIQADGIMHYANKNGALAVKQNITIDGVKYYADEKGDIIVGSMYEKAQGYSSDTDYLILVNLTTQKTAVFKGSKNNWLLQKEFICSTGKYPSITPTGEYKTTIHDLYFDSGSWRCWYATGFIGGLYLFHSWPYLQDSTPKKVADYTMGTPSSHGCVRLKVDDAKWMYDTLPLRTKVVIFK